MHRSLGFALLFALLASACSPSPGPSDTAPGSAAPAERRSSNQVLRVAQVGLPANLNIAASAGNTPLYWTMYDNLVTFDENFDILPWAAERWDQPNPTTWRVYLRKDLTFSNGDKLTAADVEFTLNYILQAKTPQIARLTSLTGVKLVDEYTVDVISSIPDAGTLAGLSYAWILPKRYFEQVGPDGFAVKPIGSGPYELVEFRDADLARFKLRGTPHPFRKPIAGEVVFRSITEATSRLAGLQTGEIDVAIGGLTNDQIQTVTRAGLTVQKRAISNLAVLFPMREMEQRQSPLRDKRIRMALNYAVDKDAINRQFFGGDATVAGQLGTPTSPFWDPSIKPYPYDPTRAKQLLTEAGYPSGLTLPNGIDFTPQTANADVMQAVQGYLREVGVETPLNNLELGLFLDKFYGRRGQSKGDLFAVGLSEPNGFATPARGNLSCDNPPENIWWCNRDFDRYMADASAELDITRRATLMRRAAQASTNDVGHLYLLSAPYFIVHSAKIKGFVWQSDVYYNFDSAYRIE